MTSRCNARTTPSTRSAGRSTPPSVGLRIVLPVFGMTVSALTGCAHGSDPVQTAAQPNRMGREIAAAAAAADDPVAARLATYLRLLTQPGGSAAEIAGFLRQNPTWPNHALLIQRLDQALAAETDASVLSALCADATLLSPGSLLRCAGPASSGAPLAILPDAVPPAIVASARAAWVAGLDQPDQEAPFLETWSRYLTPADQWNRFERLEWSGNLPAAQRTIPLLPAPAQALASARLSLRRNAPGADDVAAVLKGDASRDPTLVLDLARWLRRNDRDAAALALWQARGLDAEARIAPAHLVAFWTERDALARDLLRDHRDADAFLIADDRVQTDPGARLDSAFLSGWIDLRRLHDPADAEQRFARLDGADAVITRSRGAYWIGRARLARGDRAGGEAALTQAAAFPTTFYGQLALARLQPPPEPATLLDPSASRNVLSASLSHMHDPGWSQADAIRFAGLELARAAELLVSWNDSRHARAFLLTLDQMATSNTDHALAASLAERLGLPDVAVAIARAAGRRGLVLPEAGWPRPYAPPAGSVLPDGLALGVMRQESSFDPQIVSPAGARGLMQLTVGTARDTARSLGQPQPAAGALSDPDTNLTLGSAYMQTLLARYGGVVPYAVAAYNAGPHRVNRWLVDNGDPAHDVPGPTNAADDAQALMIDWIESIPFAETRNYVQRVIENMGVYQLPADRGT